MRCGLMANSRARRAGGNFLSFKILVHGNFFQHNEENAISGSMFCFCLFWFFWGGGFGGGGFLQIKEKVCGSPRLLLGQGEVRKMRCGLVANAWARRADQFEFL